MSELSPNYDLTASMQAAPLAFCSLNGRQQGELFPLNMAKAVLQFDSASGSDSAPPTRCLVIQGLDGVTIRTVEGEVSVNEQSTKDAWLTVGDEITCGSARLRLVRVQETQPHSESPISEPVAECVAPDSVVRSDCSLQPDAFAVGTDPANPTASAEACESSECSFFGRLEPTQNPDEAFAGNATMCVSQEELRSLLKPTVHGTDEPDYVQAAPTDPIPEMMSDLSVEPCQMGLCECVGRDNEAEKETISSAECTVTHEVPLPQVQAEMPQAEVIQLAPSIAPAEKLPDDLGAWLPQEPVASEEPAITSCDCPPAAELPLEFCPTECEPSVASELPVVETIFAEVAPQPQPTKVEITVQKKHPCPLPTWNGPEVMLVGNHDCSLGLDCQTVGWQIDCAEQDSAEVNYPLSNEVYGVILH